MKYIERPNQFIKRVSSPCYTETQRYNHPEASNSASFFEQETGVTYANGERNKVQRFNISKKGYGAGLHVSILKIGEKRMTELSTEIGLDEIEMLINFLNEVKSQCKNYTGDVTEIFPVS